MMAGFWLKVNYRGTVSATRGKPRFTEVDEVCIRMNVELPNSLFEKPMLQASMVVPKESVTPSVITPEITDNIAEAIKSSTGLDMIVRIVPEEEEDENGG